MLVFSQRLVNLEKLSFVLLLIPRAYGQLACVNQ